MGDATGMEHDIEEVLGGNATDRGRIRAWRGWHGYQRRACGDTTDTEGPGSG